VGCDLGEAIYTAPNNTMRFADVPPLGVTVQRGDAARRHGRT
jgi:myo-inositol-1-phosphate synthase